MVYDGTLRLLQHYTQGARDQGHLMKKRKTIWKVKAKREACSEKKGKKLFSLKAHYYVVNIITPQ
jgi:hypothetical protein